MYRLVYNFKSLPKHYRVTYINDCSHWRIVGDYYFLRELVCTFYDDVIDGKPFTDYAKEIDLYGDEQKREAIIGSLIERICPYLINNQLTWIVVFDQHNGLFDPSVVKNYPFSIINDLSGLTNRNVKVIVSASNNNAGCSEPLEDWKPHDITENRFNNAEFAEWCSLTPLPNGQYVEPTSDIALDAFYWSGIVYFFLNSSFSLFLGGIPLELRNIWNEDGDDLVTKLAHFQRNRVVELRLIHGNFFNSLSTELQENLKACIARMLLKLPPPDSLEGMDRELLTVIKDSRANWKIEALTPLSRKVLVGFHNNGLFESMNSVTRLIVMSKFYSNRVKGTVAKMHLLAKMEIDVKILHNVCIF